MQSQKSSSIFLPVSFGFSSQFSLFEFEISGASVGLRERTWPWSTRFPAADVCSILNRLADARPSTFCNAICDITLDLNTFERDNYSIRIHAHLRCPSNLSPFC